MFLFGLGQIICEILWKTDKITFSPQSSPHQNDLIFKAQVE